MVPSSARSLSREASLLESTLETSEAELSAMISEVRQVLKSREETLSKVEESHRVLQQEQVIKQSELEAGTPHTTSLCIALPLTAQC